MYMYVYYVEGLSVCCNEGNVIHQQANVWVSHCVWSGHVQGVCLCWWYQCTSLQVLSQPHPGKPAGQNLYVHVLYTCTTYKFTCWSGWVVFPILLVCAHHAWSILSNQNLYNACSKTPASISYICIHVSINWGVCIANSHGNLVYDVTFLEWDLRARTRSIWCMHALTLPDSSLRAFLWSVCATSLTPTSSTITCLIHVCMAIG